MFLGLVFRFVEFIKEMIKVGMNIARFNFFYGFYEVGVGLRGGRRG